MTRKLSPLAAALIFGMPLGPRATLGDFPPPAEVPPPHPAWPAELPQPTPEPPLRPLYPRGTKGAPKQHAGHEAKERRRAQKRARRKNRK